jgi:hypothetical protein
MSQYQYNLYRHSCGGRSIELGHERELSPSGLIIPRALARITFRKLTQNNTPSTPGIIIPSPTEVALYGTPTDRDGRTQDIDLVEGASFVEQDLDVFSRRVIGEAVGLMDAGLLPAEGMIGELTTAEEQEALDSIKTALFAHATSKNDKRPAPGFYM